MIVEGGKEFFFKGRVVSYLDDLLFSPLGGPRVLFLDRAPLRTLGEKMGRSLAYAWTGGPTELLSWG